MSIIHLEFEKPIVELDEKIDALLEYYEEHGCLDKPVTVVFRNNKYVLKDKFLRYYVGKMLKLKKIDAICTVD